jgi:ParB-like partition proteins
MPGVGGHPRGSELFADLLSGTGDVSRETSETQPVNDPGSQKDSQPVESAVQEADLVSVPGTTFADLPTAWIIPNHRQPREVFDEDELNELAASIREVGVLQPVVVRPIDTSTAPGEALLHLLEERPDARYELIMGERRLRASEIAGLTSVPAIVRHTDDNDLLRDALLENLHRAQLNPLEEASAYQQLMADFGATQEELAQRIARSRPQIANTLRLLRLPPSVQRKVAAGVISAGHARALLSLGTPVEMDALADRIVSEGLSVRTTEELVRLGQSRRPQTNSRRRTAVLSPLGESLVSRLSDAYDTRVTITEGRSKGRIVIEFAGPDDLQRLAGLIVPDTSNRL